MALTKSKLQKLQKVSVQCVEHLIIRKGQKPSDAENMVLEILKESDSYIRSGMIDSVIATLKMTFLDQSIEDASQDILKSLLK
jgi:hypothetical protein